MNFFVYFVGEINLFFECKVWVVLFMEWNYRNEMFRF